MGKFTNVDPATGLVTADLCAWLISDEGKRVLEEAASTKELWPALERKCTGLAKHAWVDARNAVIESGEFCAKCGAIKAGNKP